MDESLGNFKNEKVNVKTWMNRMVVEMMIKHEQIWFNDIQYI